MPGDLDSRLARLAPALSAKERAILLLRALKARTPEDPAWRTTMPQDQHAEFDRLIDVINACNLHLPLYITMVEQQTEQLTLRFAWLDSIVMLGLQAWALAELVPAGKRKKAERALVARWPTVELPWRSEEDGNAWLEISDRLTEALRAALVSAWQQLRGLDVLLDELAQEFDGEDPLRPVMRRILEEARRNLTHLHRVLSTLEPLELPEADEESLQLARTYFEKGRRSLDR